MRTSQRIRELSALLVFSTALLSLELSFTKVFSVIQWYHFGFLVISTAMLGFAAAGIFLSCRPLADDPATPSRLMTVSALVTVASYFLMTHVAAASEALFHSRISLAARVAEIASLALLLLLPFFFLGLTIGHIITVRRVAAGIYYGANLLGSACGAILFLILFDTFPGEVGVPLNALTMSLAALIAATEKRGLIAAGATGALTLALSFAPGLFPLDPPRDKILGYIEDLPPAVTYTGWSSLSKVDFVRDPDTTVGEGSGLWGISERFRAEGRPWPERQGIIIDSWAYTTMLKYPQDLSFYEFMPTTFAYALRRYDSSLHIGAGGGFDLLAAYHYGVRSVQGVEINPVIVKAVAERFGDYSGGIYSGGIPGIEIFVDEGRHFIEQSSRRWDLIQLSGVDTFSSSHAGAFALSENNLYTVEAFKTYYEKLNEDGVLTMTRWFAPDEKGIFRYELRLLNLARQALDELGVGTNGSLFYFVSRNYTVLTIKKGAFTPEEVSAGHRFITENRFIPLIVPGMRFDRARTFETFLAADQETFSRLMDGYPYLVTPPTDDRPFYFEIRRFGTLFTGNTFIAPYAELSGQGILMVLLAETTLFGIFLILLPLFLLVRRERIALSGRSVTYFAAIGAGFMLTEIVLSQKLVLYLGHPVHALSVVLFGMLLFSGIGSVVAHRLSTSQRRLCVLIFPLVRAAVSAAHSPLSAATLHRPFFLRVLIALSCAGSLSFFMGMFFPTGLYRIGDREVPAYWAVNGFFSVIASAAAVLMSINIGFTRVLITAFFLYGLATLMSAIETRKKNEGPSG